MNPLTAGYSLQHRVRHGGVTQYPFSVSLFPSLYRNSAGAFANPPFQITLASGGEAHVPLALPPDAVYNEALFRFDVTDGNYSCLLTDISIRMVLLSGGGRIMMDTGPLAVFQGTNGGYAQVPIPYLHPKSGSVEFRFRNLYPGTRAVSGFLSGYKVES